MPPLFLVELVEREAVALAGAVDQRVQARARGRDESLHVGGQRHVSDDRFRLSARRADFRSDRGEVAGSATAQHQAPATIGQAPRDRGPDAGTCTGDHRHAIRVSRP